MDILALIITIAVTAYWLYSCITNHDDMFICIGSGFLCAAAVATVILFIAVFAVVLNLATTVDVSYEYNLAELATYNEKVKYIEYNTESSEVIYAIQDGDSKVIKETERRGHMYGREDYEKGIFIVECETAPKVYIRCKKFNSVIIEKAYNKGTLNKTYTFEIPSGSFSCKW